MRMKYREVEHHFNSVAFEYDRWEKKNAYYYTNPKKLYASLIPPNKSVLEIGCATGGMKMPEGPHNRLYSRDIINLLELTGFRIVEIGQRLLIPKRIPLVSNILNSRQN